MSRPLTPARQKWEQTTGLKAFSQSVIDVLPECNFDPWKTELADTSVDLRGQIKQNHEEITKLTAEQYREILDSNPVCF